MNYLQKQAMLNKIAQTKLAIRFAYKNNYMNKQADDSWENRPLFGPALYDTGSRKRKSNIVHPGQWRMGEEHFRIAHPGPDDDPWEWYYNATDEQRKAMDKYMHLYGSPLDGLEKFTTPNDGLTPLQRQLNGLTNIGGSFQRYLDPGSYKSDLTLSQTKNSPKLPLNYPSPVVQQLIDNSMGMDTFPSRRRGEEKIDRSYGAYPNVGWTSKR